MHRHWSRVNLRPHGSNLRGTTTSRFATAHGFPAASATAILQEGPLGGAFSIVSTNTPTANATQQGLICDSGQRATAVPIAHQRVAEDCLADTLDREGSSVWAGLRFPHGSAQGAQPG